MNFIKVPRNSSTEPTESAENLVQDIKCEFPTFDIYSGVFGLQAETFLKYIRSKLEDVFK